MSKEVIFSPYYETTINKAVFINQDITISPDMEYKIPDNLSNVAKFLFGEDSYIEHGISSNGRPKFIIKNASFILNKVKTINMDFIMKNLSNNSEKEEGK